MLDLKDYQKKNLYRGVLSLIVVLSLFFTVKFLAELRDYSMTGSQNVNTITISGYGEVTAVPDIATVGFTIRGESSTAKEAQEKVATIETNALKFVRGAGIEDKDIKTTNASFNPKYEYQRESVVCNEYGCPTPVGKSVMVGYEAYETIELKIRNTDKVGEIMEGLSVLEVSNVYGPNFTIDDEDELKEDARREAITDARSKAKSLARDLGVRLGRIASFSEGGYYPMYASRGVGMDMAMEESAPNLKAEIPEGENIISSNVTITYEIR